MDISVIIVNWNTCDILRNCLASIYKNTRNIQFEVIVIDNASSDGSADMIRTEFLHAILIANTRNLGFAKANNQGLSIARGRYVLLLNSDTVLFDNAIEKIISFADSHMQAGIFGCRILNPDKSLQPTCFMFPSVLNAFLSSTYLYKLFQRSTFFGRERISWWDRSDVREVDVVTGCFMLVRQEAIKKVGFMDERFFMYAEEADWCYRFKQAGYKIMFTPDAEIIHLGGASSNQIKPQMVSQWRKSMLLYFKKHRSPFVYGIVWILINLFFLTRVPYWLGKMAISGTADYSG
jgi:GT2 family glycosyltransferase